MKLVDALDSKSCFERSVGSSPTEGTTIQRRINITIAIIVPQFMYRNIFYENEMFRRPCFSFCGDVVDIGFEVAPYIGMTDVCMDIMYEFVKSANIWKFCHYPINDHTKHLIEDAFNLVDLDQKKNYLPTYQEYMWHLYGMKPLTNLQLIDTIWTSMMMKRGRHRPAERSVELRTTYGFDSHSSILRLSW